jgi:hypothetical protein
MPHPVNTKDQQKLVLAGRQGRHKSYLTRNSGLYQLITDHNKTNSLYC